jgi:magnesium transporter
MFYLTEILGLSVYDSSGKKVGKVAELGAVLAAQPPRVDRILLAADKAKGPRAVPFAEVAALSPDRVTLKIPEDAIQTLHPDEALFLLRKDLLDQQIIDVSGRKVVRVNDLSLEEKTVNHHMELLLGEVDIGFRGALRRLLGGALPRTLLQKLEARFKPAMIPWAFVNLIEADPLRRVKLNISHQLLTKLHPADLADIVEDLPHKERHAIISALDDVTAAEALSEVDPRMQVAIVESMDTARASDIVEEMPPDAAADLLGDLSEETSSELLEDMNKEDAAELGGLLEFHEGSAGGLMTTEYLAISPAADAGAARDLLSSIPDLPENFNTIFLVDEDGKLAGSVHLSRLIVAAPQEKLANLKSEPLLSVPADAREKEIVELFDKYNLLSLPVLDSEDRLAGVVTVDDIISLLRKKL